MLLKVEALPKLVQSIQWRVILALSICLLAIHLIFFQGGYEAGYGAAKSIITSNSTGLSNYFPSTRPTKASSKPPSNVPGASYEFDDVGIDESPPEKGKQDFNSIPFDGVPVEENVAICLSVKDGHDDMEEWLVHHYHNMGIRRFYIMDDGSDPPLSTGKYPGVPRSALTFTYQDRATRAHNMQMIFYAWCIERYRNMHKWIAFFDLDEFLETPGGETLHQILELLYNNETVGALGVNWKMHTSSGLLTRPDSVRKNFTECIYDDPENDGAASDNKHIKSILKMPGGGGPMNPHKFSLPAGVETVGEYGDFVRTIAFRTPITRDRIGLHHYAVKSKAEYEEKVHRGNGMSQPKGDEFWDHVENVLPHVDCPEMKQYEP